MTIREHWSIKKKSVIPCSLDRGFQKTLGMRIEEAEQSNAAEVCRSNRNSHNVDGTDDFRYHEKIMHIERYIVKNIDRKD